ncbi:MAG: hypothetical protein WC562_00720 [Dehalococcoidia bacterium]
MKKKRIIYPVIAAMFASLLVMTVWFAIPSDEPRAITFTNVDFYVHSSVEELTAFSDTVVIGSVKGVVGHEINNGANTDEEYGASENQIQGLAMVYYEIDVTKTLKGKTEETIIVAGLDTGQSICDQVTPLLAGEEVLLFLKERTEGEAPGLKQYEHCYWIVSLDNGVFDVLDDTVQPRYAQAFVEPNADGTFTAPTYNLTEVCEKIQSVN